MGIQELIDFVRRVYGVAAAAVPTITFNDHNARHEPGGGDPMAVDAAIGTGSLRTLGGTPTPLVYGGAAQVGTLAKGATSDHRHGLDAPALSYVQADLGGDVTIVNSNTFYDGPSVSLAAGTWLVIATVTILGNTSTTQNVAKIWDGTTHWASAEIHSPAAGCSGALAAIITLGGTTTVKVSVANATGASRAVIKAAVSNNSPGNTATHIRAVRIA